MATTIEENPIALRKAGIDALSKALGPLGMTRFLQQFEIGSGNYTEERSELLKELSMETVLQEIKKRRRKKEK
ncbi:MAG: hypothetical protein FJ218_08240 [Ignavibacteria bacterium]|nr:hypothetical protein [Ignavibacteria bacterium]